MHISNNFVFCGYCKDNFLHAMEMLSIWLIVIYNIILMVHREDGV